MTKLKYPEHGLIIDWDAKTLDIRQSDIQTFLDCKRRFKQEVLDALEFDYAEGPRPWTTADIGTAVHEALGAYYQGKNWKRAITMWGKKQWPEGPPADADLDLVRIMVEGHIEDLADDGKDIGEETVAVEEEVMATIKDVSGWTVRVWGRVDRLIVTADGQKIIDDWKTVGPLTSTLDYIQQLGRYAVLIRHARGWRADRVRSTQIRKVKRTKDGPFYARPWLPLNEDAYAEHARNLRAQLTDIVEAITDPDYVWYEHVTGECSWKCRTSDICKALQQGDDTEMMVELHYRKKGSV